MKKAILTAITLAAALAAPLAHAEEKSYNLLITGGAESNVLNVKLSSDGRDYVIDSMSPLEVGGAICTHPEPAAAEEVANRLLCDATAIAGFEVNAGDGNDSVIVSPKIQLPVTLRGGPGNDRLRAGAGADRLVGGTGNDFLYGGGGDDWLFGGPGEDWLYGEAGADRLVSGPGADFLRGGPGEDREELGPGDYTGPMPHRPLARPSRRRSLVRYPGATE